MLVLRCGAPAPRRLAGTAYISGDITEMIPLLHDTQQCNVTPTHEFWVTVNETPKLQHRWMLQFLIIRFHL